MGREGVQTDLLVDNFLNFKSLVVRRQVDRGKVGPLGEPRHMTDTLLLAWPLRILVTFKLVVTPEFGVFLLPCRILVIPFNIAIGRFAPGTVSILAADLRYFRETFHDIFRDLGVRSENMESSRALD